MNGAKSRQLVERLKEDILAGKYCSEQPFPSRRALARKFGLAATTVQRALDELAHQGLISRTQGAGSFVTRMGASRKIGVIIPGVCYSEIFPPICRELSQLAQREGYSLLFGDLSASDPKARADQARRLARKFAEEPVSGVVFQPIEFLRNADAVNQEILATFDAQGIPVVLLDCDIVAAPDRSGYDIVGVNNFEAGRRLARHLLSTGARRAVFLMRADSDYSVQARFEGARSVFRAEGRPCTAVDLNPRDAQAVQGLLKGRSAPDAVICRNDALAAHLLVTLRRIGRRVPEDMRVAGFNDVGYAAIVEPALTTIHLPCAEIGRRAFEALLDRIADPGSPPVEILLDAPLVVRPSTLKQ